MSLRFAVSPLFETVAGLRLLTVPHCSQVHQRWSVWAAQRLLDLGKDHSLLNILVAMPNIPEFLIPTPGVRSVRIDAEIATLSGIDSRRIAAAVGADPHTGALLDNRKAVLAALQERLRAVHDAIIAPVWPRLEGVLQGDVERRGRCLVEAGGPRVLAELHADVSFHNPHIEVDGVQVDVGDREVVLMPSAFVWPDVQLREGPRRLALRYPARGFGSLWERTGTTSQPPLARLLGGTRARVANCRPKCVIICCFVIR
jgi:hypothetical protein